MRAGGAKCGWAEVPFHIARPDVVCSGAGKSHERTRLRLIDHITCQTADPPHRADNRRAARERHRHNASEGESMRGAMITARLRRSARAVYTGQTFITKWVARRRAPYLLSWRAIAAHSDTPPTSSAKEERHANRPKPPSARIFDGTDHSIRSAWLASPRPCASCSWSTGGWPEE